ncbi:hypothetical protein WI460_15125 [Gemmatimonadota bacterium Y43]|uniref:LVIVD repeat-containing protein n=1 Tax=Gaopeijia maritima TaxID=3119007 RepID=UPI00326C225B
MRVVHRSPSLVALAQLGAMLALPAIASGQSWNPLKRGSDNLEVVGHLPVGSRLTVTDMDIEQELDRPYAYVSRANIVGGGGRGVDIVDLSEPSDPEVIYSWRIENDDLHQGPGAMDVKHFKWGDRYYVAQSLQFRQGGPDADVGAVILDVTGLPDASTVREVGRIRDSDHLGGFHNIFIYKHSDGRVLLFTTVSGPYAQVYDLGRFVEGDPEGALVGRVPVPVGDSGSGGYHDMYVGYHPDTGSDRFYGGGTGGYYVYDVTDVGDPSLVMSMTGVSGVRYGHTVTPSPDGRYVVAETEYRHAPLRIFDLEPAFESGAQNVRQPISAWTADWQHLVHNHEVRWPYVFVSGYVDGLQIFNLQDPSNPITVGFYDTYLGPLNDDFNPIFNGTFGVDVRNEDGLIVVSDSSSGLWVFRMDGFNGWSGSQWGMPDVSSVQDWDQGPRAPRLIGE